MASNNQGDTFLEPEGHKAGCVEKAIICFCEGRIPEARCMGHEESKATANVKVASGVCRTNGLQRGREGAFWNCYSQQNFWLLQREVSVLSCSVGATGK